MKEWIKNFFHSFVKDLKNIIFALVIAIIVWFAISMQIFPDVTTHVGDIPVEVKATEPVGDRRLCRQGFCSDNRKALRGR